MFPTIGIGPLALPTSPLLLLVSYMACLEVNHRAATRLGLNGNHVYNLGYLTALAGLLGARAGFVLQHWAVFQGNIGGIFALTADGLSPLAGWAVGLVAGYLYAQRRSLNNRRLLDALAPGLVVVAGGAALADLASGNGYGSATTLPWALNLWGAEWHPVQVYHLLAALGIGVILAKAARPFDGAHFGLFLALYAASNLFLAAFHGDSSVMLGGIRTEQVASLAALLAALVLLRRWAQ